MEGPDAAAWAASGLALRRRLEAAFHQLDTLLESGADQLDFRPAPGAWTAREVAEHVALCDRFLLILARKIAAKSAKRAAAGHAIPAGPSRFEHLEALGESDFRWPHPDHMTPTGAPTVSAVRERLADDLCACLALLAKLPSGEGTLHRIRMSAVPGDDRLDLYQFLAVIALHAERHARQIRRNVAAFAARTEPG